MLRTHKEAAGIMIPPMKASSVLALITAIGKVVGRKPEITVTGLRPGEKLVEWITPELSSDNGQQYTEAELIALVKPFV